MTLATFTLVLLFRPQHNQQPDTPLPRITYTAHYQQAPENMAQSNKATTPATCALLALPAELRNTIYHLVLINEHPVEINPTSLPTHLALTQTCTQIRAEASQIFFAANAFRAQGTASDLVRAATWLSNLGDHSNLISDLTLAPTCGGPGDDAFAPSAIQSEYVPRRKRRRVEFQDICDVAYEDALKVSHAFQQVVEESKLRSAAIKVVDGGGELEWCDRLQSAFFRARFTRWRES